MTINKFVILGERCSGTNFLEEAITQNFDINYTTEYGNKHFFCFNNYTNNENTLFIGIIRNPIYWLNSFSKELHHIPNINKNLNNFLFNEFYSVLDIKNVKKNILEFNTFQNSEIVNPRDLNYLNGNKYKNIFELRKIKNYYLMNIMPYKVKNYILINYENLLINYKETLELIKNKFNLTQKYPIFKNITKYKKSENFNFVHQRQITFNLFTINTIWQNLDINQESILGYNNETNETNEINEQKK
jgi:hypothetical protein